MEKTMIKNTNIRLVYYQQLRLDDVAIIEYRKF